MTFKKYLDILSFFLILVQFACQSPSNSLPQVSASPTAPPPSSTASPVTTSSPVSGVSTALPELLTDAIKLVECLIATTKDADLKSYAQSNLNVMKRYDQTRWELVRHNDPDGKADPNNLFAKARQEGCN